jgi:hypothetical protein
VDALMEIDRLERSLGPTAVPSVGSMDVRRHMRCAGKLRHALTPLLEICEHAGALPWVLSWKDDDSPIPAQEA